MEPDEILKLTGEARRAKITSKELKEMIDKSHQFSEELTKVIKKYLRCVEPVIMAGIVSNATWQINNHLDDEKNRILMKQKVYESINKLEESLDKSGGAKP